MKRIILVIVFSFISFALAFSQEKDSLFKKSSIGGNYVLNINTRFREKQHLFGLSFDYNVYRGLYVSTGIMYNKKIFHEYVEHPLVSGTSIDLYEKHITHQKYILPVNLKYYYLKNSTILHPYLKLGMSNE